jgi:hypothetical protein
MEATRDDDNDPMRRILNALPIGESLTRSCSISDVAADTGLARQIE